jgi:hypothetical protein
LPHKCSAFHATPADEAQEVGEEDELEAMFKPKKKRRQERDQDEKKSIVEELLARMEVRHWLPGLLQHNTSNVPCAQMLHVMCCLEGLPWDRSPVRAYKWLLSFQVAAELDKAAYEEGRPAIHKLQMLADVDRVSLFAFSSCASSPCEWCAPAAAAPALSVVIHAGWLAHWQTSWVSRCQGASLSALCVSVMRHNTTLLLRSYRTWCSVTCTTSSWTEACWASSGD